jgi:hypothetical protein
VPELVELPEPGVPPAPDLADVIGDLRETPPGCPVERVAVVDVQPDRLQEVAVAAELQLARGGVAAAYRSRAAVAVQVELRPAARLRAV